MLLASWWNGMEALIYCIPSFSLIVSLPCLFTYSCWLLHAFVVHDMSGLCFRTLLGAYAVVQICTYIFLIFCPQYCRCVSNGDCCPGEGREGQEEREG